MKRSPGPLAAILPAIVVRQGGMFSVILWSGLAWLSLGSAVGAGLTGATINGALDSGSSIAWQTAAEAWSLAPAAEAHDGVDALRTPVLRGGLAAGIQGTVLGPGVLRGHEARLVGEFGVGDCGGEEKEDGACHGARCPRWAVF